MTFVLLAGQVAAAAVAFAMNILAARVMTPADRGVLALALQLTYLATVFALLGVERPYAAHRQATFGSAFRDLQRLVRPGLWLVLASLLASAIIFACGLPGLGAALLLASVFLLGNVGVRVTRTAFIASGATLPFVLSVVISQLLLLAAGCGLLLGSVDQPSYWLGAYAATSLVAGAVAMIQSRRDESPPPAASSGLAQVRAEGLRMLPASLGNTAMLRSDRLLLPLLASTAELGIYVVVATAMEVAAWPTQQWADASLRRWRLSGIPTVSVERRLIGRAALLSAGLSAALAGIAYVTVRALLPQPYQASLPLIAPLAIAAVFYSITRVQQGLLIARGEATRVSVIEITGMIASLVFYVTLIPPMGAMGAAVGSALGYMVCLITASRALALARRASEQRGT